MKKKDDHRVRVTKVFTFEMAHALHGYDGPCRNIHGHSYELSVTVIGIPISNRKDPKNGMVIDFSELKQTVNGLIIEGHDHALILNRHSPHKSLAKKKLPFGKVVMADFQPTCENLLKHFAEKIKEELPGKIKLHHLKLKETPSSYAEWYAEDNE